MSPEQAEGRLDRLGPTSDVYSLGATLYCLLTGHPPFQGDEVAEVLSRVRDGSFPRPRELDRAIPPALEAICLKAMALRPEDRYPSARILAGEIDRWLADEPISARRDPWPTRLSRWARRHKPLVTGAGALLITALIGLSIGIVAVKNEQRQTETQRVALKHKSDELSQNVEALRRKDYINRVNLAFRECTGDNVALADKLLDGCPEDLRGWEWSYVKRQCHLELKTFAAKSGGICSVAFSPDGRWIASGEGNINSAGEYEGPGELVVRDVASGQERFAHRELKGSVNAVAVSPDGRWLASGSAYGVGARNTDLALWDADTGTRKWIKTGLKTGITKLKVSPDSRRIVACFTSRLEVPSGTSSVRVWDVVSSSEVLALPPRQGSLSNLDISTDGKQIALAVNDIVEV
jgi:hypothetical protein